MAFFKEERKRAIVSVKKSIQLIRVNPFLLIISFVFAAPFVLLEALSLSYVIGYRATSILNSIFSILILSYLSGGFIGVIGELLQESKAGMDTFKSFSKEFFLKILTASLLIQSIGYLTIWISSIPKKFILNIKILEPITNGITLLLAMVGVALIVLFYFVDQFIVLERREIVESLQKSARFVYQKKRIVFWFFMVVIGLFFIERGLEILIIVPFTRRILPLFFIESRTIQFILFILSKQIVATAFLAFKQTYPTVFFIQNQD